MREIEEEGVEVLEKLDFGTELTIVGRMDDDIVTYLCYPTGARKKYYGNAEIQL